VTTKLTPKNTVDALRLLYAHELYQDDDPEPVRDQLASMATLYVALKRDGETDQEFLEWYETADMGVMNDLLEEAQGDSDPSPASDES
jgi:hypothetical protein